MSSTTSAPASTPLPLFHLMCCPVTCPPHRPRHFPYPITQQSYVMMTSSQKSAKARILSKVTKVTIFCLFLFYRVAETVHGYYVQLTTNTPVCHPSKFNLQTRLPQLTLQLHFVSSTCKTGIYSIVTRKPCFYKISLL